MDASSIIIRTVVLDAVFIHHSCDHLTAPLHLTGVKSIRGGAGLLGEALIGQIRHLRQRRQLLIALMGLLPTNYGQFWIDADVLPDFRLDW